MITEVVWDKNKVNEASTVFSNGDLTAYIRTNSQTIVTNFSRSKGKWYFELKMGSILNLMIGVVSADVGYASTYDSIKSRYYRMNGTKSEGSTTSSYGASYSTGNTIGVALDLDVGTIEFYKNGVSQGVAFNNLLLLGEVYPAFTTNGGSSSNTVTAKFTEESFDYPIPNGYKPYGLIPYKKVLLKSDDRTYSLEYVNTMYETNMTSNNAPAPLVASASSVYSTTYPAWKAFNGTTIDVSDCWLSANGKVKDEWIQIDFGNTRKVNEVKIKNRTGSNAVYMIKDFDILGSNDGVIFNPLVSIKNQSQWLDSEERVFYFKNSNYRYYRIKINENNGGAFVHIGDILFGYETPLTQLHSATLDDFINYGATDITNFNAISFNKNYILQAGVSENADGLWVQEIDRKPLSIKFE